MSKIITVFGATGNQGGSVIRAILADSKLASEFKIRGVTRDTSKPAAQALASKGVELVSADMNALPSIAAAIKGSHTVFLVTNYWETGKPEVEIAQGHNVANAAKEAGVSQLIFSSLVNVTEATHGRLSHVDHFDGKAKIQEYIRDSGIGCAFVLPGYFMSNFASMMRKDDDGSFNLAYPIGKQSQFPLIDVAEDLGKFVTPALRDSAKYNKKHLLAAQDYYDVDRIISEFTEVTGKHVNFNQVTHEQYKGFLPPAMGQEMLENYLLIEEPGYYVGESLKNSLDAVQEKLVTWKEFVAKTKAFQG